MFHPLLRDLEADPPNQFLSASRASATHAQAASSAEVRKALGERGKRPIEDALDAH
jgi:hypothetical protein